MRIDELLNAHEAFLDVRAAADTLPGSTEPPRFSVALGDDLGQDAGGACILDLGRRLRTGETWAEFLQAYLACDVGHDALAAFGRDLFGWLVRTSGLADAWAVSRSCSTSSWATEPSRSRGFRSSSCTTTRGSSLRVPAPA